MAIDTPAARAAGAVQISRPAGLPRDGAHHTRGDIEGLRAVAVLLVIADHLFGWPHGGFVGVDVFFVISGFLITGLLLREHSERGRISFADFYRRRVRRILPASLLVLVATTVAAQVVFFGARARATADDALWSLLFAGNWHFAIDGTDYQQAGGPVSPLQHYWSLSVEEQFYVVWPVVLAIVLAVAGGSRWYGARRTSTGIAAATGVLVVVGFAWAQHETATHPAWAYFSTFSRAWELGLGALLAVAAPAVARIPAWLRPLLGWCGLAGICLGALLIGPGSAFPAPGALLPAVSAVVLIAAGTGGESHLRLLTNPVARYLGALSYSLYLWHFPVLVVLAVLLPPEAAYYALVLAGTAVAATASYHLVEQPIRRSNWLRPGGGRPRERRVARVGGWAATAGAGALAVLLVVLPATGSGWPWDRGGSSAAAAAPVPLPVAPGADPAAALSADISAALSVDISAALSATEWPELSPGLDARDGVYAPEWVVDDCLDVRSDADADRCVYGDPAAGRTAVLLGDSVGISWMPGIRGALEAAGWQVRLLTLGQCGQVTPTVIVDGDPHFAERCAEHQAWAVDEVQRMQPDLVIMSSAANSIRRLASGATGDAAFTEWREGLAATLTALDTTPTRLVVLGTPPPGANLVECATRFNSPQDCVTSPDDGTDGFITAEQEAVAQFRGTSLQASYVDTRPWFCDERGRCPSFVAGTRVFADGTHLTAAYSAGLAGVLAPVLLG